MFMVEVGGDGVQVDTSNFFRSYRDSDISEPHWTAIIISSPALLSFPSAVLNSIHLPSDSLGG
jgi:hypothetical protein